MAADITAIILTKNEEVNILDCIRSIATTVKRIVVVDSFSTDNTVEYAKKCGVEVYQHPFETHARQYKYAVKIADIKTKWILRIDADERLTPDSANELEQVCNSNMESDVTGIVVRFKKNFLGKDLYHGGVYPWKKLICYKTGKGNIEDRAMDEHIVTFEGKTVELKYDSLHFDFKSLEAWTAKHNYNLKKSLFTAPERLVITPVSKWLGNEVKNSFFRNCDIEVVYNGVNLKTFHPRKNDFKEKNGLCKKKVLLGVAVNWVPSKGLDDLIKLSDIISEEYKIVVVGLTKKQKESLPDTVLGIEKTSNSEELAEIYSAAEVFVNPSREETFGMVTAEALACGTPAVVYDATA